MISGALKVAIDKEKTPFLAGTESPLSEQNLLGKNRAAPKEAVGVVVRVGWPLRGPGVDQRVIACACLKDTGKEHAVAPPRRIVCPAEDT